AEADAAAAHVQKAAATLSKARRRAAGRLAGEVEARLGALAMPGGSFAIKVEPAPPGPAGADRVTFLFGANEGIAPAPVQRVASGGELSRLMLALELALGDAETPTLVFDEVDAGVGGAAGAAVGALL